MTRLTVLCLLFSAASIATLRILPSTGWIVAEHLRQQTTGSTDGMRSLRDFGVVDFPIAPSYRTDPLRERLAEGVKRDPDDFATVYTACVWRVSLFDAAREAPLRELSLRFPGRADLRAHILRLGALYSVHIVRPELDLPNEATRFGAGLSSRMTPAIANFIADARAGQKLDAGNAFFPVMEAVGHLCVEQDDQAVQAIRRAAACERFDDYTLAEAAEFLEAIARWDGRRGVAGRAAAAAAVRFPHLNQIRLAGRALTGIAAFYERAGNPEAALRIREDLLRAGRLMRARSKGFLFTQVAGANLARAAIAGGNVRTNPMREADGRAATERALELDRFEALAGGQNRNDLVRLARSESEASRVTSRLLREGRASAAGSAYRELAAHWNAGGVLLALSVVLAAISATGLALFRDGDPGGRLRGLAVAAGLVVFWLGWQHSVASVARTASFQVIAATAGLGSISAARMGADLSPFAVVYPMWLVLAGIPALVTALAYPVSRRTRASFPATLCAFFAVMAATVSLAAYPVAVLRTRSLEARIEAQFDRLLDHQGRYIASMQGVSWPE